MWTLIVGAVVCTCGTIVGAILQGQYRARAKFAADWSEFCVLLKQDISYLHLPLAQIVREYLQKTPKGEFRELLARFAEILERDSVRAERVAVLCKSANVRKTQGAALQAFLNDLGRLDEHSQLSRLERDGEQIARYAQACAAEEKKLGGLALKLGFLLGLAVMILIA